MAVEKKPEVVLETREDEMLVTGVAGKDDLVGVDVVFSRGGDLFSLRQSQTPNAHKTTRHARANGVLQKADSRREKCSRAQRRR